MAVELLRRRLGTVMNTMLLLPSTPLPHLYSLAFVQATKSVIEHSITVETSMPIGLLLERPIRCAAEEESDKKSSPAGTGTGVAQQTAGLGEEYGVIAGAGTGVAQPTTGDGDEYDVTSTIYSTTPLYSLVFVQDIKLFIKHLTTVEKGDFRVRRIWFGFAEYSSDSPNMKMQRDWSKPLSFCPLTKSKFLSSHLCHLKVLKASKKWRRPSYL